MIIHSYSESTQTLTGVMHALGVPDSSSEKVTTFFHGEIQNDYISHLSTSAKRFPSLHPPSPPSRSLSPSPARASSSSVRLTSASSGLPFDLLYPAGTGLSNLPRAHLSKKEKQKQALLCWRTLGPFKHLEVEELESHAMDKDWLEDKIQGWVLMRWKEKDFINTTREFVYFSFYGVALGQGEVKPY